MRKDRIEEVKRGIKVFELKLSEMEARIREDPYALAGCKETGAVRRASLDLTRALADMRKPDHA